MRSKNTTKAVIKDNTVNFNNERALYSHLFPLTYPCELLILEADMVIVNSTPYLPLLLCSNLRLMSMHRSLVFYSSHVHWSLSCTMDVVDVTGIETCKEVESVSGGIVNGRIHAV